MSALISKVLVGTAGNLATNFGFGVVQGLVAEKSESPEEDSEGIHLRHELSKSLAITLVGTVIGGPIAALFGAGLLGTAATSVASNVAYGLLGKATGFEGDITGGEGSQKKGPGGWPSKKYGKPSGRGRMNNPPKQRRWY